MLRKAPTDTLNRRGVGSLRPQGKLPSPFLPFPDSYTYLFVNMFPAPFHIWTFVHAQVAMYVCSYEGRTALKEGRGAEAVLGTKF